MNEMDTGTATGFAIITSIVLVVVIVYTIIKLRKQVRKTENAENRKLAGKLPPDDKSQKDGI